MKFVLMQKDVPVLTFKTSDDYEKVNIIQVLEEERLPFHLQKKGLSSAEFEKWLLHRNISKTRQGAQRLVKETNSKNILQLSVQNNGLSLSDSYWIKNTKADISWDDVNFFKNGYSEDIGNYLLKNESLKSFVASPDICTNGCLEKAWKRVEGKDYLFKLGKAPFNQQPINEVLCCEIAKRAFPRLSVVEYHLAQAGDKICSACENFVTENIEFVPASYIYFSAPLIEGETVYSHFLNRCRFWGIRNVEKFLSNMIAFDYLICNQDRHLGNFGFLRNVDSGLFIGPAPLFDNGNSLWFDEPIETIGKGDEFCKPFESLHEDQIALIKKVRHINTEALKENDKFFEKCMKKRIDETRIKIITKAFEQRIKLLDQKIQELNYRDIENEITSREER